MKKYFVSFEIAKILKEKGFNQPCIAYYDEEDNSDEVYYYCNANYNVTAGISCFHDNLLSVTNNELDELGAFCYKNEEETESYERLTAPEYHEVIQWLLENYTIWIEVHFSEYHAVKRTYQNGNINITGYYFIIKEVEDKYRETIFVWGDEKNIDNWFNSPYEAYEKAILYTLKNII